MPNLVEKEFDMDGRTKAAELEEDFDKLAYQKTKLEAQIQALKKNLTSKISEHSRVLTEMKNNPFYPNKKQCS